MMGALEVVETVCAGGEAGVTGMTGAAGGASAGVVMGVTVTPVTKPCLYVILQPVKKAAKSPTALLYCRTSTTGQREARTIGAQQQTVERIVDRLGIRPLKYGPKRDGWLIDDGVSGSLLQGRTFGKAIDDIEAGRIRPDFIVVYSLSRIAREDKSSDMAKQVQSAQDWGRIKAVLRAARVKIIDEDGENDPNNVLFDLKTSLAGEEYKLIRARTMAGKSRWLGEGRFARGGRAPYGYKQVFINRVDGKDGYELVEHPENGARLRKVLGWFVEGGYAYAARKATEAGWPPSTASTKRKKKAAGWNDSVRYVVLHARTYLGEQSIEFGGKTHTIRFPALIGAEMHAAVLKAQKEYTLAKRTKFLSTGFVDCACGRHAFAHSSRGSHAITCRSHCGRMPEARFSHALWTAVVCRLVEIEKQEGGGRGAKDHFGSQLGAATARVTEIEERMGRLYDQYDAREVPERVYKQRNAPLRDEHTMASAEVARITRERDAHMQKRTTEQSLAARVGAILEELVLQDDPTLERQRELLAEVLGGERVLVTWLQGTGAAELTLPKFRGLPVLTMRTDQIPSLVSLKDMIMYTSLRMADFPAVAAKFAREEVPHPSASPGRGSPAVVERANPGQVAGDGPGPAPSFEIRQGRVAP